MNSRAVLESRPTRRRLPLLRRERLVHCLPASDLQLHASSAICITALLLLLLLLLRALLPAQPVTPGQTLLSLHLFAPHQFG